MRRFIVIVGAASSALAIAGFAAGRHLFSTWGIVPIEGELTLPGDDLVPDVTMSDTRGITIDAPPSAVWPWLLQLGFGRGGWYSYDAMDMQGRSADAILPEHQALAVGDIVPTDPNGGFEVKALEPDVVIPMHCSGLNFVQEAIAQMGADKVLVTTTGSRLSFGV